MSQVRENWLFAYRYAKTKPQIRLISCVVTAQLISAFVFTTQIIQSLFFLNPKFKASSYLLWLHSPVCVGPGQKPRRQVFSLCDSNYLHPTTTDQPQHLPNWFEQNFAVSISKFYITGIIGPWKSCEHTTKCLNACTGCSEFSLSTYIA